MRIIKKTICYNEIWSKQSGILPSITDCWTLSSLYNKCNSDTVQGKKFYSYNDGVRTAIQYNLTPSDLHYNAEFVFYDVESLKLFPNGNYHTIVSDIIIPGNIANSITDYTDLYVNIPNGDGDFYDINNPKDLSDPHYELNDGRWGIYSGGTEIKILTYHTLIKWWKFFCDYNKILDGNDEKKYNSAVEYYDDVTTNEFVTDREKYEELDTLFKARGGKIMYEWISSHCFLKYVFRCEKNESYEKIFGNWLTDSLTYVEAIKWYSWFETRYNKYRDTETYDECVNTDDCCDCREYIKLGGKNFFLKLKAWMDGIDLADTSHVLESATLNIPISLTSSIDDLGEMSIFSNEWESGNDYAVTLYNDDNMEEIERFGTVISKPKVKNDDYKPKTLFETYTIKWNEGKDKRKGYIVDSCYSDVWFKEDDWVNYTDYYIKNNIEQFNTHPITSYTFSPITDEVIYNPTDDDVFSYTEPTINDFVLINGVKYNVVKGKYVVLCDSFTQSNGLANIDFKNNKKIPIYTKRGSCAIDYCIYKGKKYFVERTKHGTDVIRFFKEISCVDTGCTVYNGEYIIYNDEVCLIENGTLTLMDYNDGKECKKVYPVLNGYFSVNETPLFLLKNGDDSYDIVFNDIDNAAVEEEENGISRIEYKFSLLDDAQLGYFGWSKIPEYVKSKNLIKIYYKYDTNQCTVVSGYSESSLYSLRRSEVNTDDLGYELPGYFNFRDMLPDDNIIPGNYNTVYDGAVLDILFVEGTVSNLSWVDEEKRIYNGNYLDKIYVYLVDSNYESLYGGEIFIEVKPDLSFNEAIRKLDELIIGNALDNENVDINTLPESELPSNNYTVMVDFEYYIGCTLKYNETDNLYTMVEDGMGIKHIDTATAYKTIGTYNTDFNKSFTYVYYELIPFRRNAEFDDGGSESVFESYFEYNVFLFTADTETKEFEFGRYEDGIFKKSDGIDRYNNLIVSPIFRNEWDMYSSTPKMVSENIYIDRGVNTAFEKHLKLQEVRSMEALEKYGINYFKIEKR